MIENKFYNGILYQIEYRPELSNTRYNKHYVYYVKTDDDNYHHSRIAITSILEDIHGYNQGYLWSIGTYKLKYKNNPTISNALHPYYKFSYNEELDVYVYIIVEPYDD